MRGVNIEERLIQHRNKLSSGEELLQEFKSILERDQAVEDQIRERIGSEDKRQLPNAFNLTILNSDNIFSSEQIKRICVVYRLRFLESSYFKMKLPYEAIRKIKELEKEHRTELTGFKIMAPAKSFRLKNADDPLLFAPMGNGYYYLIHKWGNDLSPWRKLKVWPCRNLESMAVTIMLVSLTLAAIFPWHLLTQEMTFSKYIILAFIIFQWTAGLTLFYFIKKGRNFSPSVWQSNFFNA